MKKNISLIEVAVLILLSLAGVWLWFSLSLPRFEQIHLNINQAQSIVLAQRYLKQELGIDPKDYIVSAVFDADDQTDRYLQKTVGTRKAKELIEKLNYDLFYWIVRFYKEKQKEEFKVVISSSAGAVIAFYHDIEETAARETVNKDQARQTAIDFLKTHFGFDPDAYLIHAQEEKKYDRRVEYAFSWENKGAEIPWDPSLGGGSAKLLIKAVVSGHDILSFNKSQFDIPDAFNRYIDNLKQTGQSLSMLFKVFYLALLTLAIMILINRKNHHVPRIVKPLYWGLGIAIFIFTFVETLNAYQVILFEYSTAQSLANHLFRQLIESLVSPFFVVLAFIIPALAGEALRVENFPKSKHLGLLSPVLSSFFNRPIAQQITVGYLVAFMVLGLQSAIFTFGYHYCGVWDELSWLTQASTNVLPAFTAFLIGVHAAFSEEAMFRVFAINFFKRYTGWLPLAVVVSALIWGFGHTGYEIFPMWFRGFEVTCLGLLLGAAYVRYGLITVLVAHYFMDSFLTSLPYLLNPQFSLNYISSVFVICLPLVYAVFAYVSNHATEETSWEPALNPQQRFNYELLKLVMTIKPSTEHQQFKEDLLKHGWDPLVVNKLFHREGQ